MANNIPKFGSGIKDSDLGSSSDSYYKEGFKAGNKVVATEVNRTLYNLSSALTAVLDAVNVLAKTSTTYSEEDLSNLSVLTNKITTDLKTFADNNTKSILTSGQQNIKVDDVEMDNLVMTGKVKNNFSPYTDDTYDLGSATKRWQDLYLSNRITIKDTNIAATSSGDINIFNRYNDFTYSFGINDGKFKTRSKGLDIVSNDNIKITAKSTASTPSGILFDGSGLRIYNSTQVDISDDTEVTRDPNTVDKIKIGGKQNYIDAANPSTEKNVMLMYKKGGSSSISPFAIDKDGKVWVNGYTVLNSDEVNSVVNKKTLYLRTATFQVKKGASETKASNTVIVRFIMTDSNKRTAPDCTGNGWGTGPGYLGIYDNIVDCVARDSSSPHILPAYIEAERLASSYTSLNVVVIVDSVSYPIISRGVFNRDYYVTDSYSESIIKLN